MSKSFSVQQMAPGAFAWSVWAAAVLAALAFVGRYGHNVPYIDEQALVPYVTGTVPVTAEYIWAQHNDHRIPLPKLLLLGLSRLTGCDFRAGMYVNVLALGGAACVLMVVARRLRGRTAYTDAFIPLLLLHWGHCENLLWSWQVQFALSTILLAVLFLLLVREPSGWTLPSTVGFGLCLILLPLCGSQGLPFAVLLAGWLAWVGIGYCRSRKRTVEHQGRLMLALAVAALGVVGVYFIGYRSNPGSYFAVPNPSLRATLRTAAEVLSMSLGPAVQHDYTPRPWWPYLFAAVLGLIAVTVGLLLVVAYRQPGERPRALGMLVFVLGVVGLALGVGRAHAGEDGTAGLGLEWRYVTIMAPALYVPYLVWVAYTVGNTRRVAGVIFLMLVGSLTLRNAEEALIYARMRARWDKAFLKDLHDGQPTYLLARRYCRPLSFEMNQEEFARSLEMFHLAGIRPYQDLRGNPPFAEEPVAVGSSSVEGIEWTNHEGNVTADTGHLLFTLPTPQYVAGIRVRIRYPAPTKEPVPSPAEARAGGRTAFSPFLNNPWARKKDILSGNYPRMQLSWKTPGQQDFVDVTWGDFQARRWQEERILEPEPDDQVATIWVGDTIDHFKIYPTKPLRDAGPEPGTQTAPVRQYSRFIISEIVLLLPKADGQALSSAY